MNESRPGEVEFFNCHQCGADTLTEVGSGVVCLSCGYTFAYPSFASLPPETTEQITEEE